MITIRTGTISLTQGSTKPIRIEFREGSSKDPMSIFGYTFEGVFSEEGQADIVETGFMREGDCAVYVPIATVAGAPRTGEFKLKVTNPASEIEFTEPVTYTVE